MQALLVVRVWVVRLCRRLGLMPDFNVAAPQREAAALQFRAACAGMVGEVRWRMMGHSGNKA